MPVSKKSIIWRWVRGNLLLTVIVLLIVEVIFAFSLRSNMYDGARNAIMSRVNTLSGQLSATANDSDTQRSQTLRRLTEDFQEREKFELMLLGSRGQIVATSSGVVPQYADILEDFAQAQKDESGLGEDVTKSESGEPIMSICWLLPYPAGGISAVRFVTGLEFVDQQIIMYTAASLAAVGLILLMVVLTGIYFIRSIVMPLSKVEQSATRIAAGDFDARIDAAGDDEIGRLCVTINEMAGELGKTEQLKNDFISSVSHELRTPLTSIKGWTETLARVDDPTDENYKKGLAIITDETDRLYKMVEELLDFSRLQNGRVRLETELLDLVAEVTDALLTVEQRAKQEQVALEFDEPVLPYPVMADKNRLRQIFLNILDNALKYSPVGGTIRVEMSVQENTALVRITDEGPGIRPEDLASIKLKFYKGQGAVRGSGIGLAVVDEMVTMHGGSFTIESRLGQGTSAVLLLPLAAQTEK